MKLAIATAVHGQQARSDGSARNLVFLFGCNADAGSCHAPIVGQVYTIAPPMRGFECDNYLLINPNDDFIHVCLANVEQQ
jgi:hypothetical protein